MLLALALASTAHAGLPTWTWKAGTPYLYHMETEIRLPSGQTLYALNNTEARALRVHIALDTTCIPKAVGKNTELTCTLQHIHWSGDAFSAEQDKLDKLLAEYDERVKPATVVLLLGQDGRLKEFDVQGLQRKDMRSGEINELMRIYLLRVYSILHLPLPNDAKDFTRGWKDPDALKLISLITLDGTVGSVELMHKDDGMTVGLQQISSEARGTVAKGAAVDSGMGHAYTMDVRGAGASLVDDKAGELLWRGFDVDMRLTANAERNSTDAYMYESTAMQKVDAFNDDGSAPVSILALRQPMLSATAPAVPAGTDLVAFSTLGMQPLFLVTPLELKGLGIPKHTEKALVLVNGDGSVASATVYSGYEVLAEHVQNALKAAHFTAAGKAYAVDCDVEIRPE